MIVSNNGSSAIYFQGTSSSGLSSIIQGQGPEQSLTSRLWNWISRKKTEIKTKIETVKVQYVFNTILKNAEELEAFNEKNKEYQKLIDNAKLTGQTALVEELEANKQCKLFENQLVTLKMTKCISEANILKFADKCEKGLKLDWIRNFTRVIPDEVIKQKIRCDELELFDNYVVLYFDPDNKATKLTKEEIEKKKDPILFGVMRGSRKLYFVGDWKDDLCDLTFDQIVKQMSEKETTLS